MSALNSIAILRARKGLSQAHLAKAAAIPCKLLKEYEAGTRLPRLDYLVGIAAALDTNIKTLANQVFPAPKLLPKFVPTRSSDPIQAEIDDLRYDLAMIENKDFLAPGDSEWMTEIRDGLYAAHERMRERDAVEFRSAAE
ncbi:MAG TPA: helix-turn-helix transcriptional regulator [Aliidongia sp.]|uniref:helix-turn-helix transcriptional regulator n=1 Tax=Aliidongia sp. TaxID=1914230 RepID=UPI002DDD5115|nr:helix-turn-helix transcriptional regulator [Aliidongia sp.]HEV2674108.1 helix-turn-helix transcriptional regulator [Aliidongia sp.]